MDAQTIQTYNQMAKEYDEETIVFWDIFPRNFFDRFIALVSGKILDVGSGPGRDGLVLKNAGLEVTCLDASEAMIAMSKARGLDAVLGDFLKIPFGEASFDGAWVYTSLLHVPKSEIGQAVEEIRRVLKDGGIFGLGLVEGIGEGYRESSGVQMPRWFSYYAKEEVEQLLKAHGFEILHFEQFKPKSKNYLNFIAKKVTVIPSTPFSCQAYERTPQWV